MKTPSNTEIKKCANCGHGKEFHTGRVREKGTSCTWFYMTTAGDNGCRCKQFVPAHSRQGSQDGSKTLGETSSLSKDTFISSVLDTQTQKEDAILKEVYKRVYPKLDNQTKEEHENLGLSFINNNPIEKERVLLVISLAREAERKRISGIIEKFLEKKCHTTHSCPDERDDYECRCTNRDVPDQNCWVIPKIKLQKLLARINPEEKGASEEEVGA